MKPAGFTTRAVHGPSSKSDQYGALRFPVYDNAAFEFESAESMEDAFAGRRPAHAYTRISNPTVEAFEKKITLLENGLASAAVSSGMAAISGTLLALLDKGDSVIFPSSIFGGTYSLLRNLLGPLGITVRFVPTSDVRAFDQAMDATTRAVFLETIANPGMAVPDFRAIAGLAHDHNIVVLADSTVTTPYLFKAREFGVDVVVHSTTKYISGGATSIGGVIVDLGTFDWTFIPSLRHYHKYGEMAFIARMRKEVLRDTGGCLSPHNAGLQLLGLETLAIRMDRICRSAASVVDFLMEGKIVTVNYPGLASSPFNEIARKQFGGLYGGVLSFGLPDKTSCFRFLNGLTLIRRATNLGDNKTLAIHPASTIFAEFTEEERKHLGVDGNLIRLSIGIEEPEDLFEDIQNALKGI